MTRFAPTLVLLAGFGLAACNGGTDGESDPAGENATVAGHVAPTGNQASPVSPQPERTEAIDLKEKSDALEFSYRIPAEAAAIPGLADMLKTRAETAKRDALTEHAEMAESLPVDAPARAFELTVDWSVAADTPQLLVLTAEGYDYRGGAHGMPIHRVLYWDKAAAREIPFDALFTDRAAALATVRDDFCAKLDKARADKRGISLAELKKSTDDTMESFTACPEFDEKIPVAFTHPVGGKFGRITFIVPPYIAGPYAEGDYTLDLMIPKAMIPYVADKYRPSFPGTGN
ncbi:DUF4163 domain-containing protein [Stakelama saccharophila]|uniref:DUF4163 domain-containing protein n=1 Tax=Stakelama saccharophila TaxID=3075605 RepID=A0ABZ0B904_9SPHN|nr:DUF4163 domain-containing protein [Stakelama sp. W311]WNO53901.1 DUF4163 domain-containing protein [Stakelama sp. W311]